MKVRRTVPHLWESGLPSNTRLSVSIVKISSIHSAILQLPQRIVV